jgi:hypothetical protein
MMHARFLFGCCLALALSACTQYPRVRPELKLSANPSALVAQEIALAQETEAKGRTAALLGVINAQTTFFVPEPVQAAAWLKTNTTLPTIKWDPQKVIISCDGKTGVTTGAWRQDDGTPGYVTNMWQRFEKSDGTGKWFLLLTHSGKLDAPRKAPEFVITQTASCKGQAPASLSVPAEGVKLQQMLSRDQSLSVTWQYRPDRSRQIKVAIWDGEKMMPVLTDEVSAPAPAPAK